MSRYNAQTLYNLLPAVYRRRDAERGYPLRDLVEILARQAELLEGNIAELYDNAFVETAAPWAIPYIGDLIGLRNLPPVGLNGRAEVANMIGYRRRKGTAAVLELLARDVTQWPAHVVEFFDLLPTTQHMNHLRLNRPRTPDLRRADPLDHVDRAFDTTAHLVDVRHILSRRGRHNIPNVGLYLFRLTALPLLLVDPTPVTDPPDGRYTFSTLGNDVPLFHHPVTEVGPAHISEEVNVPASIRPRALHTDLEGDRGEYYGISRSIAILTPTPTEWRLLEGFDVIACDLRDWNRPMPPGSVGIDPALGRLRFSGPPDPPEVFRLNCYQGFSAQIGGGQYERAATLEGDPTAVVGDPNDPLVQEIQLNLPAGVGFFANLADALVDAQAVWNPGESRVIEIVDSRTYRDNLLPITIPAEGRLTIRAANEQRPTLLLPDTLSMTGGDGSAVVLSGLLIAESPVELAGTLNRLSITDCTLVPGFSLDPSGAPINPGAGSLTIESNTTEAEIRSSILGGVRTAGETTITISDSILDAHDVSSMAYAGTGTDRYGGPLTITRSTVIGAIDTAEMTLGENSIFLGIVTAERRQQGCVRFSWVPRGSHVPRRFHCQPEIPDGTPADEAARIQSRLHPCFSSLRYGRPAYCQLDWRGPVVITQGADDESEMGVFSKLKQPQREAALRVRLDEFLPVGLKAGIFFAT
jgi:hypothetical protein